MLEHECYGEVKNLLKGRPNKKQVGTRFRVFDFLECRVPANIVQLLVLQDFVNDSLCALVYGYDFMYRSIACQSNVDNIIPRIEHPLNWRAFIEHVLVDGDLGSLRLGLDA
jgi:hypothetical protein